MKSQKEYDAKTFPITRASFNLTRNCNLRCTYPCFTNGCKVGDMPLDVAKKCVDFLFKNAVEANEKEVEISFWGGEPLLRWFLLQEIVLYAEGKSAQTAVRVSFGGTTNGVLLTPEKFDFLDKHKIFFMVSFDGTKETHDYHRKTKEGFGSHKIIERNLKEILKRWPIYRIRMSPFSERIEYFFEDCKSIFDLGCNYLIFSPVYESNFTEGKWLIWEEQCKKVVDYMKELQDQGRKVEIEYFKSYTGKDNSKFPCGASRFYCGFDIDGAIYPCHRFNKYDDDRPWQEKEVCIGHVDVGITNPEFRQTFIDFKPQCGSCSRLDDTVCHGGCYAINFEFTGSIDIPYIGLCRYTEMQKRVSSYYKEKIMGNEKEVSCMPYQGEGMSCDCYNSNYTGPTEDEKPKVTMEMLATLITDLNKRLMRIEEKINE